MPKFSALPVAATGRLRLGVVVAGVAEQGVRPLRADPPRQLDRAGDEQDQDDEK